MSGRNGKGGQVRISMLVLALLIGADSAWAAAEQPVHAPFDGDVGEIPLHAEFLGEGWAVEKRVYDTRKPPTLEAVYGAEEGRRLAESTGNRVEMEAGIRKGLDGLRKHGLVAMAYYTYTSEQQRVEVLLQKFETVERARKAWAITFLPFLEGVDFTLVADVGDGAAFRPSPPRFHVLLGDLIIESRQTIDRGHGLLPSPPTELLVGGEYKAPDEFVRVALKVVELFGGDTLDVERVWRQQPPTLADHRERRKAIDAAVQNLGKPAD